MAITPTNSLVLLPVPVAQSLIIIWKGLAKASYLACVLLCSNRMLQTTLCPPAHWHNFRKTAETQAEEMVFIRSGLSLDIPDYWTKSHRPRNVNSLQTDRRSCFHFLITATDINDWTMEKLTLITFNDN